MPRTARAVEGGGIYHVLNRGNGRMRIFHKPEDYESFVKLLGEARERARGVDLLGLWRWSSDAMRATRQSRDLFCQWPVDRPRNWSKLLEEKLADKDLDRVRTSVKRGRPYGSDDWVHAAAERLDLAFTLRPRGRLKGQKG